jgi:hypothetical protein
LPGRAGEEIETTLADALNAGKRTLVIASLPDHLPPRLAAVSEYWHGKCHAVGDVPHLTDIDLMDIYAQAPYLFMADKIQQTPESARHIYRWRYWGTAVRDFTGVEATGRYLHETQEEKGAAEATADYDAVLSEMKPSYWKRNVRTTGEDRSYLVYERVVFPLRAADGTAQHILGVFSIGNSTHIAARTGESLAHTKIGLYEDDEKA